MNKSFFVLVLIFSMFTLSQSAFADESEKVCEIIPPLDIKDLQKEITKKGCEKGDLLLMRDVEIETSPFGWMILIKRTAAHVCDLEIPFPDGDGGIGFKCYYLGFVRKTPINP